MVTTAYNTVLQNPAAVAAGVEFASGYLNPHPPDTLAGMLGAGLKFVNDRIQGKK